MPEAPDAIAIFNPKDADKLRPFLDLDDGEESDGLYAEELEGGAMLVHTFQPYAVFAGNPDEALTWLGQFADVIDDVHDDPRGMLFFPDDLEPTATTYDGVVAQVSDKGTWVPLGDPDAVTTPGIDLEAIQAFAGQLLSGGNGPPLPFEVGKMLEGMQKELLDVLGVPQALSPEDGDVVDAEFGEDDAPSKKETKD